MPIETYLSAGGRGVCHQYFYEETSTQDIMRVSHSLCLAHISDPEREGSALSQPYFSQLIQTFKDAEGYVSYLPVREQIGMFLQVRATCSFALTFCTSWYQEHVRRRVLAVMRVLRKLSRHARLQLSLGCVCSGCDLVWLVRGWQMSSHSLPAADSGCRLVGSCILRFFCGTLSLTDGGGACHAGLLLCGA